MRLLSMKTYLALLWGMCVMFAVESMTTSTLETGSFHVTVEPNKTTRRLTTAPVQPTTWDSTHKPAEVSVAAAAENTVLPTFVTEEATVSDKTNGSNGSPLDLVVMSTAAAATSSSGQQQRHTSAAVTTAAGEAPLSDYMTQTAKHVEDHSHQQSATTGMTAPATTSTAASATVVVSSPQPTPITEPEITSKLSSTTSSDESTRVPVFIQTLSSPSASTTTTRTTNPTSPGQTAPGFDRTSSPETPKTSTELSSPSQSISAASTLISTSQFPDTAGSRSASIFTSTDSPSSTTAISTTPAGIPITHVPTKLPIPTTKSAPVTTTAPCEVLKTHPSTEVQPCSTRGLAKNCLIVIAIMSGLATIFMVSTIILCTKLSARKYKLRKPHQSTEMMCISALLPEMNYTYTRARHPVRNGVLVMPAGGDSDEDGGDNLTLSSFLPENDRYV